LDILRQCHPTIGSGLTLTVTVYREDHEQLIFSLAQYEFNKREEFINMEAIIHELAQLQIPHEKVPDP